MTDAQTSPAAVRAVTHLRPGDTIDGFCLECCVHRGNMASLWRVTRADLSSPAIMKLPSLGDEGDPTAIVNFEVEQMILPRLTGPHVPRYITGGTLESQPYIVMEEISGETLLAGRSAAPLTIDEVVSLGVRVATALHELHRQHVMHLDLKPGNVMFRADGTVVLIDYGLAHHDHLPDLLAEEFRVPLGSAPYMSPEQVLHIRNDPRSDLFSLGVLLYVMLTGERPYGDARSVAGLRQRLWLRPTPPRLLVPACPPWLQEVILHCLEPDADKRYATAAQVAFDLSHPTTVPLTERAERRTGTSLRERMGRWLHVIGTEAKSRRLAHQLAAAPIVMVGLDPMREPELLAEALRLQVRNLLLAKNQARLACVSVLRTPRIAIEEVTDDAGRNQHVQRLVELKNWARALDLPDARVTYHVLKGTDVVDALLDYARVNRVDHIVVGTYVHPLLRRYWGGISADIVARADCTVTVVRAVAPPDAALRPAASSPELSA